MVSNTFGYEKLILTAYGGIETAIAQMDNAVVRRALSSFSAGNGALEQSNQILLIIERKRLLIELKEILDKVFKRMSSDELNLFAYKFFKKSMPNDFDYTSRAYFRRQLKAIGRFSELLSYAGLTQKSFLEKFSQVPYIKALLIRCTKQLPKNNCEFAKEVYC